MFGHKDGKVEAKLLEVIRILTSLRDKTDTKIRIRHSFTEEDLKENLTQLELCIGQLKKIKEVSGKIHDLIQEEL